MFLRVGELELTEEPGTLLRTLRKRARLTQEQLAERSEVSVRTIRRLENGHAADHRLTTMNLLANALGAGAQERRLLMGTSDGAQPEPVPEPERPAPVAAPPVPTPELADVAASLAGEVRRRWRREEEQRRVHDPFPLPVRWEPVPSRLMDHPENIQRVQPGSSAPGLRLSGDVRVVAETYRSIVSGRLVVLGRAGSGKSSLAIRFALDLLSAPESRGRVPVIFSLGSWDPATTALRDFLVGRLLRDHPHLARRVTDSSTLASALVDADLILPVLDGFDEMAEHLRVPALTALNATSLPLFLTSRRDEYAAAVREAHTPLVWAAGIELTDLTVEDLADYLPRADRRTARDGDDGGNGGEGGWEDVLQRLGNGDVQESEPLAQALRTPLMVTLARAMYTEAPGRRPAELLDAVRFPTTDRLEEHLLAGFVPAVYRHRAAEHDDAGHRQRNRDPHQVQRWLGHLAQSMTQSVRGRQDLAWWRLGHTLRVSTRVLHAALVSALCMAVATWLVQLLVLPTGFLGPMGAGTVLLQGALVGLLAGAAAAGIAAVLAGFGRLSAVPSRFRLRLPAADRHVGRRQVRTFTVRFGLMLLVGAALGAGYAWAVALIRAQYSAPAPSETWLVKDALVNMLMFGLIVGLTAGLVFAILSAFEAPMDITAAATPIRLLSVNRTTAGRQFLVLAPVIALGLVLCGYLVVGLLQELTGPLMWQFRSALLLGMVGGLGGSASYVFAFTAWGQWLTLSRVWLPLRGRLPWDTVAFLEDAYRRGVLRQAGAVYQFRHIRLQRHLAHAYRHRHVEHAPGDARPGR